MRGGAFVLGVVVVVGVTIFGLQTFLEWCMK